MKDLSSYKINPLQVMDVKNAIQQVAEEDRELRLKHRTWMAATTTGAAAALAGIYRRPRSKMRPEQIAEQKAEEAWEDVNQRTEKVIKNAPPKSLAAMKDGLLQAQTKLMDALSQARQVREDAELPGLEMVRGAQQRDFGLDILLWGVAAGMFGKGLYEHYQCTPNDPTWKECDDSGRRNYERRNRVLSSEGDFVIAAENMSGVNLSGEEWKTGGTAIPWEDSTEYAELKQRWEDSPRQLTRKAASIIKHNLFLRANSELATSMDVFFKAVAGGLVEPNAPMI